MLLSCALKFGGKVGLLLGAQEQAQFMGMNILLPRLLRLNRQTFTL